MKLATFNVNSIRARTDLLLRWLEKRGHDLDILCLQELEVVDIDPFGPRAGGGRVPRLRG